MFISAYSFQIYTHLGIDQFFKKEKKTRLTEKQQSIRKIVYNRFRVAGFCKNFYVEIWFEQEN